MRKLLAAAAVAVLVLLVPALGNAITSHGRKEPISHRREAAEHRAEMAEQQSEALLSARLLESLSREIGFAPDQCQSVGGLNVVCSWEIFNRAPSYLGLAGILGTTKVVYMVCTLPKDGSPRVPQSCSLQAAGADTTTR